MSENLADTEIGPETRKRLGGQSPPSSAQRDCEALGGTHQWHNVDNENSVQSLPRRAERSVLEQASVSYKFKLSYHRTAVSRRPSI
jgi:hypothetical protein